MLLVSAATASRIPKAFFALRAGAMCTAMQRCTSLPPTCPTPLKVASLVAPTTVNITGPLDLCSREGVVGGNQLVKVLTPAGEAGVFADQRVVLAMSSQSVAAILNS